MRHTTRIRFWVPAAERARRAGREEERRPCVYFDHRPCQVCGAEIRLRPREGERGVAEPDATVDERVCTNPDCESHAAERSPDAPTP